MTVQPERTNITRPGALIEAHGWGWRHAGRRRAAVRDLDIRIEPGERVLLLGASGAGKSTLLQALAGVLGGNEDGQQHGVLSVNGKDPRTRRGRAGLLLQDPDSGIVLARVGDDIAFGLENTGVPPAQIWGRVDAAAAEVGLELPHHTSTAQLSGGQKQRLALAGVLAMQPNLLLLDEPTANLDPTGVTDIVTAVDCAVQNSGATLIVVEHRVAEWLPVIHRIVVLGSEGVIEDGPARAVLATEGERLTRAGVWVPGYTPAADIPRAVPGCSSPLLTATSLTVGHRSRGVEELGVAARDISFTVRSGSILAVTGPNGSGKSTLALTAAGLLPPLAGKLHAETALAQGLDPRPLKWRSRALARRVGMVFQNPSHQFLTGSVLAELLLSARLARTDTRTTHTGNDAKARAEHILERLGLARLHAANPFTLSGGEKRRLSVATAIAAQPRLLVLDEPTFGQDFITWSVLVSLIGELVADGVGALAISHDELLIKTVAHDRLHLSQRKPAIAA